MLNSQYLHDVLIFRTDTLNITVPCYKIKVVIVY